MFEYNKCIDLWGIYYQNIDKDIIIFHDNLPNSDIIFIYKIIKGNIFGFKIKKIIKVSFIFLVIEQELLKQFLYFELDI